MSSTARPMIMAVLGFTMLVSYQNCGPQIRLEPYSSAALSSNDGTNTDLGADNGNTNTGGSTTPANNKVISYGKTDGDGLITEYEEDQTAFLDIRSQCDAVYDDRYKCENMPEGASCEMSYGYITRPKGTRDIPSNMWLRNFKNCSFAPGVDRLEPFFNKHLAKGKVILVAYAPMRRSDVASLNGTLSSTQLNSFQSWLQDTNKIKAAQGQDPAALERWLRDRSFMFHGGMLGATKVVFIWSKDGSVQKAFSVAELRRLLFPLKTREEIVEYLDLVYNLKVKKDYTQVDVDPQNPNGVAVGGLFLGDGHCNDQLEVDVAINSQAQMSVNSSELSQGRAPGMACD